jgi:hypothetical protein
MEGCSAIETIFLRDKAARDHLRSDLHITPPRLSLSRKHPMRSLITASLLVVLAACAEAPAAVEELTPIDGVADVAGQVLNSSGAPVTGDVTISCGGGAFGATVPTDAQGRYHAFLSASGKVLGGDTGRVGCHFSAGAIHTDATVGFGPPGLPHVLQIVNLRAK